MIIEPMHLTYNEPVVLEGQLFTDFFFGRYGYGSTPETDEVEHARFLALDELISVQADDPANPAPYEGTVERVDRVQLAFSNEVVLDKFRGHGVRLHGRLYPAHTGHHHAPVLMHVQDEPMSIDLRNVHPGAKALGNGTGFLLGNGGLIGTAAHVLEGADLITVARGLYRQVASAVAVDHALDLAILKIEPRGTFAHLLEKRETMVRPLRWMIRPRLGERVYAFGFPLRGHLPHSLNLTEGLISSEVGIESHHFQMSAAIQPGNSGGPVYDEYGNLLGVAVLSLEPAQTVNFCVHGFNLHAFCHEHGAVLAANEDRAEKVPATILGYDALHTSFEVEVWER